MQDPRLRTLYDGDLVRIREFQCNGVPAAKGTDEWAFDHEIVFLRSGTFVRYDSNGKLVADVNQVLFFHQGQPYQVSHPVSGTDCSTIFSIARPVLIDLLRTIDPTAEDRPDAPFLIGHSIVNARQRLLQYQLVQAMLRGSTADQLEIEELILALLGEVVRNAYDLMGQRMMRSAAITAEAHSELADHVKLVLAERFRERLKLDEIAQAVSSSPYHLCRVFKQESGLSIHQYLQRLRLVGALDIIADRPNENLTDVALDFGFSSYSHFSTSFGREFTITPSEFRRTMTSRMTAEMRKKLKA